MTQPRLHVFEIASFVRKELKVSSFTRYTVAMRGLKNQEILFLWTGDHRLGVLGSAAAFKCQSIRRRKSRHLPRNSIQLLVPHVHPQCLWHNIW